MKGLKQFGAMAMAAALTITMVAPITANAQVTWTREKTRTVTEDYEEINYYKYTYTNEDTKESVTLEDQTSLEEGVIDALSSDTKAVTITVNSYNQVIPLTTTKDVAKYSNFKANKKNLKVKVLKSREETDTSTTKTAAAPDYYDKDGNAYYKNVDGKIVKVEKAKISTDMPKGDDGAEYTVRLYAKKAGTYKLKFDAIMKNGTTVKKTIKVIAKDYAAPIKSITFAGKTIYQGSDDNGIAANSLWTKGSGPNVTTAKSGKIQVTMSSKDFKLKKIEVGTPNIETITEKDWVITRYKENNSSLDNSCTWKKVKNGKKIKLAKVDTSAEDEGWINTKTTKFSSKNTTTTTYIRVTYYDKKNKTTERTRLIPIFRIQK